MTDIYLDSAYVAKCYLNEPDSEAVRQLLAQGRGVQSSWLCAAEVACALHRHIREGLYTPQQAERAWSRFQHDIAGGGWLLLPVSERILLQVGAVLTQLPPGVFVRAGDAIHLITARTAGFREVW